MKFKTVPCIRCGVCCLSGPCCLGSEDVEGICKQLIIHRKGHTSCKLYDPKKEMWQAGCILGAIPDVYKIYKEMAEGHVGHELKGLEVTEHVHGRPEKPYRRTI